MKTPKMLKVMYNGEYLCNVYPHATWFELAKYRIARGIRIACIQFIIAIAVVGVYTGGQISATSIYVKAEDKSDYMYQEKIDTLKNAVVTQLLDCERSVYGDDDGLVTYDPTDTQYLNNQTKKTIVDKGEMSYGVLQFKKSTVQYYTKLQTGKVITGKEALMIALDKESASKLAKYVMFETRNKASVDWKSCAIKYNLDSRIDIIKNLEK